MTSNPYLMQFQTTAGDTASVTVDSDGLVTVVVPGPLTEDETRQLRNALSGAVEYLGQRDRAQRAARMDETRRRWRSA